MTRKKTSIYVRGYTLVELMVALGVFALVITLAAGSYLMVIDIARREQVGALGIDSLSFAVETMMRTIRTGTAYQCGSGDCSGENGMSVTSPSGTIVQYSLSDGAILQNGTTLTDRSTTRISSLKFYVFGTAHASAGDYIQPHVTVVVSGEVSSGHGETETFTIESGATMRGIDL